jgi:hypothetical protein
MLIDDVFTFGRVSEAARRLVTDAGDRAPGLARRLRMFGATVQYQD